VSGTAYLRRTTGTEPHLREYVLFVESGLGSEPRHGNTVTERGAPSVGDRLIIVGASKLRGTRLIDNVGL
jgi:hypothetical protein